ncbi:hypothetical protein ABE096_16680 [Robertmurraya massiliosenegalensis]|uniref:hypothetical protein n=1 Tax=Robertmurraya TaxID=2837507 RepID=UPI0039A4F5D6
MDGVIFGLFTLSMVLVFGAIYNTLSIKKPGFYPPKKVLKRRALALGVVAIICLFLGMFVAALK